MLTKISGIIAICRFLMVHKPLIHANVVFLYEFANLYTQFNKTLTISTSASQSLPALIPRKPGSLLMEHCVRHKRALTFVHPVREGVSPAGHGRIKPFVLCVLLLVPQFGHLPRVDRTEGVQLLIRHLEHVSR